MWLSGGGGEQGRSWGSQTTGKMGIKKINIIGSGYLQELWSIKPLQTLNCWIQSLSVSPEGETGLESPELLGTGFFINQSKRKKTNKQTKGKTPPHTTKRLFGMLCPLKAVYLRYMIDSLTQLKAKICLGCVRPWFPFLVPQKQKTNKPHPKAFAFNLRP